MQEIDYELALTLLNTGQEVTLQCSSGGDTVQELYLGVGPEAYLDEESIRELMGTAWGEYYCPGPSHYMYLTKRGLQQLLTKHSWVLTEDDF